MASLSDLSIGLAVGAGCGFLVATTTGFSWDGPRAASPSSVPTASPAHGAHGEGPRMLDASTKAPELAVTVTPDAASGWNVRLDVRHFRFAPEHAGGIHRAGEGHAHLFVDGRKRARLYGPWFHLPSQPLEAGTLIEVALYSNDHRALHHQGRPLRASVTLEARP
ncbi:MAG: hypothetical protein AAGA56_16485 [Myxococcota bacterium]